MSYLVDTDWVADWLKGTRAAVALLSRLRPAGMAISAITYGEIYEGIYSGRNQHVHERGFRQFLRAVPVLPVDRRVLRRFARLRGQLRAQGQLIGDMDLLIAATAITHGRTVVTRNRRHFERVPGLTLHQ